MQLLPGKILYKFFFWKTFEKTKILKRLIFKDLNIILENFRI